MDDPPFLEPPLRFDPTLLLFAPPARLFAPPLLLALEDLAAPLEEALDLPRLLPLLAFDFAPADLPLDLALLLRPPRAELLRPERAESASSPLPDSLRLPAPGDNILRTTSEAAETKAAPIFAALSAAASALCAASRPACFAVLRTLALDESAAAAATSPAASMLRAIGFWASSAARWPASRRAAGIFSAAPDLVEPPDADPAELFFELPLPPLDLRPDVFAFAIAVSCFFITDA